MEASRCSARSKGVPSDYVPQATRERVAAAAHYRCEYCQTAQKISGAQMHVEHIIPLSRGGTSEESNLTWSCAWCNSYKWARTHGRDPETGQETPLFNPRDQRWEAHFYINKLGRIGLAGFTEIHGD